MRLTVGRSMLPVVLAAALIGCGPVAPTEEPAGSQVVVRVVDGTVVLTPRDVPAGPVRFIVEGADKGTHSGFEFVSRSGAGDCPPCDAPTPLLDGDVERLRVDAAPQGLGHDSGWGAGVVLRLQPGVYAFIVPGPGGGTPGTPPASVTVLTVTP